MTRSADQRFFSNGLDLGWITSKGEHPGGDRRVFATEAMALFARMITFPLPTVCAVNGHGFGAGLMIAMCHDVRVMRADRGYMCANEVELGFAIRYEADERQRKEGNSEDGKGQRRSGQPLTSLGRPTGGHGRGKP